MSEYDQPRVSDKAVCCACRFGFLDQLGYLRCELRVRGIARDILLGDRTCRRFSRRERQAT